MRHYAICKRACRNFSLLKLTGEERTVYCDACAARWQSGYAADCNSVYAGSIPTLASITYAGFALYLKGLEKSAAVYEFVGMH